MDRQVSSHPNSRPSEGAAPKRPARNSFFARMLPPAPLFALQPVLNHIVARVAKKCPTVFDRLGDNCRKTYLINPTNLPFALLLQPNPAAPALRAVHNGHNEASDVQISATFKTLFSMIDGKSDGDALFFHRDLDVEGDIEALVALRNALDDMDATLVDEVIESFGLLSGPLRKLVGLIEKRGLENS